MVLSYVPFLTLWLRSGSASPFEIRYEPDQDFVGRGSILDELHKKLAPSDSHSRLALFGLGGVGYIAFFFYD